MSDYQRWTVEEEALVKRLYEQGYSRQSIYKRLPHRTPKAIDFRIDALGCEREGFIQGDPLRYNEIRVIREAAGAMTPTDVHENLLPHRSVHEIARVMRYYENLADEVGVL